MFKIKSGITTAALMLGGLHSESAIASAGNPVAEEKQPPAAVHTSAATDWLAWAVGGVAAISALGAAAGLVREELRKNGSRNGSEAPESKDSQAEITEAVAFVQSLMKLIPEGPDGEDMRTALEIKNLQLEGGWVTWDWRPGVKMYVEALLPEDSASMTPWQQEIHSRVSILPERPEYGFPKV